MKPSKIAAKGGKFTFEMAGISKFDVISLDPS